jgi:hypothetical protein
MRYHDMKLRDAAKMATVGAAIGVVIILMLAFRSLFSERFLDGPCMPLLAGLAISVVLAAGGVVWYFGTTPAQNARFLEKHKGRVPENFDWTLLDASDPDFHTTTWRYFRERSSGRR